jgi:hypothetical protein
VPVSAKLSLTLGLIEPRIFVRNEIAKKIIKTSMTNILFRFITINNHAFIRYKIRIFLNIAIKNSGSLILGLKIKKDKLPQISKMEIKYFSLGQPDTNKFVKIFRIIFGVVCFAVAFFWISFNLGTIKSDGTVWITIAFLFGFGFYQIWSGLGKATRFIEIGKGDIRLKKNAILPPVKIEASEISSVDFYPLNVIFILKSGKRVMLRFGTTFYDINERIIDELLNFCEANNIPYEVIEEKL